jgi:DNA helicase-2/ATP-dependent DNA helicase PcrA
MNFNFNKEQQNIINSIHGAYLIAAPVGTGKTTVLTERVVKAIEAGIKPSEILCLTFTNRAAEEMRTRLRQRVKQKEDFDELTISTFHGFCAYLIKAEAKALGLSRDFVIFDDDEQCAVMTETLKKYPHFNFSDNPGKREILNFVEELYKIRMNKFTSGLGIHKAKDVDPLLITISQDYLKALSEQNALDFNELVMTALEALYYNDEVKNKWLSRFKFIQLDEFQDTHLSEYLVVKELAKQHKNLTLIGDLDQTIYGWRGSEPLLIKEAFLRHFKPVTELSLTVNYRFSQELLTQIKKVLAGFALSHTGELSSSRDFDEATKCLFQFNGHQFGEEIDWVITQIKTIKDANPKSSMAVLARTNSILNSTAEIFERHGIAHLTVDQYNFFRRQEIKDVLAHLKIIFNPFDLESAYRIASRPPKDLGEATLTTLRLAGEGVGLKISDFLNFANFSRLEPFADLIKQYEVGRVVVLDTETTGTNPLKDEIIQIYAQEIVNGEPKTEFHFYLKNTIPVGASAEVHRLTDEFLAENGQDPTKILNDLKTFIGASPIIGHNVNFDATMIISNAVRLGIDFKFSSVYDTLDLARRLVVSDNYKLNTLARLLGLTSATHSADDDVGATIGLLKILVKKLELKQKERATIFAKYAKKFIHLAGLIASWKTHMNPPLTKGRTKEGLIPLRPDEILTKVLEESGLREYYAKQTDAELRLASLDSLVTLFKQRDNPSKTSDNSLKEIVAFCSLAKNIDFLGLEQGKIPIMTVHQVKGLEFDNVFVIGLNENSFPLPNSRDLEEEKRLFYVALTRAKQGIYLSSSNFDHWGRPQAPSRFLNYLK